MQNRIKNNRAPMAPTYDPNGGYSLTTEGERLRALRQEMRDFLNRNSETLPFDEVASLRRLIHDTGTASYRVDLVVLDPDGEPHKFSSIQKFIEPVSERGGDHVLYSAIDDLIEADELPEAGYRIVSSKITCEG